MRVGGVLYYATHPAVLTPYFPCVYLSLCVCLLPPYTKNHVLEIRCTKRIGWREEGGGDVQGLALQFVTCCSSEFEWQLNKNNRPPNSYACGLWRGTKIVSMATGETSRRHLCCGAIITRGLLRRRLTL